MFRVVDFCIRAFLLRFGIVRSSMNSRAFDTERYVTEQQLTIAQIIQSAQEKLYIEFGGKLLEDRHAARVLPGYEEDAKFRILESLLPGSAVICVVSSHDIMRGRIRGDFKIPYGEEILRLLGALRERKYAVQHVAISRIDPSIPVPQEILTLEEQLRVQGYTPHRFFEIEIYRPDSITADILDTNPFIEIDAPIVGIISPGGGSGKFGVCLSQLYHEMKRGLIPRYLKFETFPVHDLPLNHPLHLAFMAASADFYDVVKADIRHGNATSYNRDIENYELLATIANLFESEGVLLRKLSSATSMGINRLTSGIIDEETICREATEEVKRRVIRYAAEVAEGKERPAVLERARELLAYL